MGAKPGMDMQGYRLWWAGVFAAAFAFVESAIVVYLRAVLDVEDLIRDVPPLDPFITATELGREVATLVLLAAAGWAIGRNLQTRLGFSFFVFGLWDIFYYVWLKVVLGWPDSLLDPDILFLIPLPWWGPVLSPLLIALLCVFGGVFAVICDERGKQVRPRAWEWVALAVGVLLVLYAFMADAIAILPATAEELNRLRPSAFRWPAYLAGLAAMAWPVLRATWPPRLPTRRST